MADENNGEGAAPATAQKERTATEYVVLMDVGDGLTYQRIGVETEAEEVDTTTTFQGFRKQDALSDAVEYVPEGKKDNWLVAIPVSSFKPARQKEQEPPKPSFEFGD